MDVGCPLKQVTSELWKHCEIISKLFQHHWTCCWKISTNCNWNNFETIPCKLIPDVDKGRNNFETIDSLRWFSQSRSPMSRFGTAHPVGLYDPQIRTRPIFLYSAPTTPPLKFHHPMFTRSEVIVLTNAQTNRRRWKHLTHATTLGNDFVFHM